MPPWRCWIGWFGLLAEAQGQGYAHTALGLLEAEARAHGATGRAADPTGVVLAKRW